MNQLKQGFVVHVCKYLGIALVAGSIVHAGTLGGSITKYLVLIVVGIGLTVYGNILEHKIQHLRIDKNTILLAIALSFGTGMLSGGIQHFDDNPGYGSLLLALGFFIAFISFGYANHKKVMNRTLIIKAVVTSLLFYTVLVFGVSKIIPQGIDEESHHSVETNSTNNQ